MHVDAAASSSAVAGSGGSFGGAARMSPKVTNVVVVGLGGQGVVTASDVLARAVWRAGYDVKKADVHGMSQRGGSVASDVRFGRRVWSPTIPPGEADYALLFDASQRLLAVSRLRRGGVCIGVEDEEPASLPTPRGLNLVVLGRLSRRLDVPYTAWRDAIEETFGVDRAGTALACFELGRGSEGLGGAHDR